VLLPLLLQCRPAAVTASWQLLQPVLLLLQLLQATQLSYGPAAPAATDLYNRQPSAAALSSSNTLKRLTWLT
jgi:hypothetical protein